MSLKKGSMREAVNSVHTVLRSDEELLRLLYYPPMISCADSAADHFNLTDVSFNIIGSQDEWDIINHTIIATSRSTDIEENRLCRIYVHPGRRKSRFENYLLADQEIVINVYVHESYDKQDMRLVWINDRIAELLVQERVAGMGKLQYISGSPRVSPLEYVHYEHIYQFVVDKK